MNSIFLYVPGLALVSLACTSHNPVQEHSFSLLWETGFREGSVKTLSEHCMLRGTSVRMPCTQQSGTCPGLRRACTAAWAAPGPTDMVGYSLKCSLQRCTLQNVVWSQNRIVESFWLGKTFEIIMSDWLDIPTSSKTLPWVLDSASWWCLYGVLCKAEMVKDRGGTMLSALPTETGPSVSTVVPSV